MFTDICQILMDGKDFRNLFFGFYMGGGYFGSLDSKKHGDGFMEKSVPQYLDGV